jgi:hypothetical protein
MISRRLGGLVALGALAMGVAGCYGDVPLDGTGGDGGTADAGHTGIDATMVGPKDATPGGQGDHDSGHSSPPLRDADSNDVDNGHTDGSYLVDAGAYPDAATFVDAGLYRGDGSFFVDGGAYPDVGTAADASSQGGPDARIVDAAPGCGPLAACCSSLVSTSQSLCNAVVAQGSGTNCATELTELEMGGSCMGVSVLATQVQVPPNRMVSDGATLFWLTGSSPSLLAMPVGGGTITILAGGSPVNNPFGAFLAVDSVNVYVLENYSVIRIPKDGDPVTCVSDVGAGAGYSVSNASTLGTIAYWIDNDNGGPGQPTLKRAPLLGGAVSLVAQLATDGGFANDLFGVTTSTVFVGGGNEALEYFSMNAGTSMGQSKTLQATMCYQITSDTDAIYCVGAAGSNLRIASDGTTSTLGTAVNSSYIVFDDTYVYWADMTTVGTIMRAPKAGGGTATILARDTNPTAIAVDANYVYWGDQGGNIERIAK